MIYSVPPPEVEPAVRLARWQVIEVSDGSVSGRFLVGHDPGTGEGRMSTPIQRFDAATRIAPTRSGRRYELVGPPGHDPDGSYVWDTAMARYHIRTDMQTNVSDDYAAAAPEPVGAPDRPESAPRSPAEPGAAGIPEGSVGVDLSAIEPDRRPGLGEVFIAPPVQDWLAQDPAHAGDLVRALERHGRKRAPFSIHGPLTITTGDTAAGIVTVVAGADGTVDGV